MKVDFYRTISTIVESDVSSSAKAVMVCLLNYMNRETGLCFPSITTIADGAGLKPTAVKKAISDLKESGLIEWESKVPKRSNAKVNHYSLLFVWSLNDHMKDHMNDYITNQTANQSGDRSESDHEPIGTNKNKKPIPPAGGDSEPKPLRETLEEKYGLDTVEFVYVFNEYVKTHDGNRAPKTTDKSISESCDVIDKLIRLDGIPLVTIKAAIRWARTDDFWCQQVKSLGQLRKAKTGEQNKLQKIMTKMGTCGHGASPKMSIAEQMRNM